MVTITKRSKESKPKKTKIQVGDVLGDMTVVGIEKYVDNSGHSRHRYTLKCNICGRTRTHGRMKNGTSASLSHKDCLNLSGIATKKGQFYSTWCGMRQRTTNPNAMHYDCYGGRGIRSDEFKYFVDFYDAMHGSFVEAQEKYGDHVKLSLERIDVNGNYCKENCCWIPLNEQSWNTRALHEFKAIAPDGTIYYDNVQGRFAKEHGLDANCISHVLCGRAKTHKGWKFEYVKEIPETKTA